MVEPPGEPAIKNSLPSRSTMTGVIELSILFPGSAELALPPVSPNILGTPGFTEKSSISLLSRNPALSATILLPKVSFSVVVTETAFPHLSAIE